MADDETEASPSGEEESGPVEPGRASSNTKAGFRNIVRRIQLAAEFNRLSKANREESDCFEEDVDVNARRRSRGALRKTSIQEGNARWSLSQASGKLFTESSSEKHFVEGEIKFLKDDCNIQAKPFVSFKPSVLVKSGIARVFRESWQLDVPKIITFVITSKSHKCQWRNKKQIENFQTGIAKAAMSTDMWILTNGLNCRPTNYICSAIEKELKKNRLKRVLKLENIPLLVGIAFADDLSYGNLLTDVNNQAQNTIYLENKGFTKGDKFELNPQHSHFIIAKNEGSCSDDQNSFTLKLVQMLVKSEEFFQMCNKDSKLSIEVPLVSILIEGGPEDVNTVLSLVKKQMPVVVLRGSGGLADIIASVYFRISSAFSDVSAWDPDYIEEHVKPLLGGKIGTRFSELKSNHLVCDILRDQVIECIRLSRQEGREYLSILDMHKPNLCNLSEHLLNALLKARRNLHCSTIDQILRDFDLILDWNCAQVAKNLLFAQNSLNITDHFQSKFDSMLTRHNREQFVELFLSQGFQMHRFLKPSQLSKMFRKIHEDEFFHTVCWEAALGQASTSKQNKYFIESDLNWLIMFCTGLEDYVKTEILNDSSQGNYKYVDSMSAERKALTLVCFWAVMQNRYELVKVLWKYSDHPVHLALFISMFFERLSYNVMDINTKAEMKQKSKEFAEYAIGVLDKCYNEDISQAYNVLRESIKDYNYMTAVDIAASAQLKQFIAHPCCQKWLTTTFQGQIRLREVTFGFFTVPVPLKILMCSLLIFPMYIWVRFKENALEDAEERNVGDHDEESDVYEFMYGSRKDLNLSRISRHSSCPAPASACQGELTTISGIVNKAYENTEAITIGPRFTSNKRREVFVKRQPPLWKMIKMMWGSPITKFYTSQMFYLIFLTVLSLGCLYPNCGSIVLDGTIFIWTILILIGHIRHTLMLVLKYSSISIYGRILEIVIIIVFALIFFTTRILRIYFFPIYGQKVIMSLALLYFYYRLIWIYLPISPTLGPLLQRFHLMITVDFVNYMRITTVILMSNAIILTALQFPFRQLTFDTVTGVLYQGLISLLGGSPPSDFTIKTDLAMQHQYCPMAGQPELPINGTLTVKEENSWIMYFFVFQFYIVLKLIVGPLLFSIFAATASKWIAEIDNIWKFQRYQLVVEFENRLSIPDPFSLFYYLYQLGLFLLELFGPFCQFNPKKRRKRDTGTRAQNVISFEDCLYWKELAAEYLEMERKKGEEAQLRVKEWESIQEISEEIAYEKKVLREIKAILLEMRLKSIQ